MDGQHQQKASRQGQSKIFLDSDGLGEAKSCLEGSSFRNNFPRDQRQNSVGYNLQHEFETLAADLDLDLKNNERSSSGQDTKVSSAFDSDLSKSAPGSSDLNGPLQNLLLAERPLQGSFQSTLSKGSLSSILGSYGPLMMGTVNGHGMGGNKFYPSMGHAAGRPQSAHDLTGTFSSKQGRTDNFYEELFSFTTWLEGLSLQESIVAADHLCSSLPLDVLLTLKTKLDVHLLNPQSQVSQQKPNMGYGMLSPYAQSQTDLINDIDSINLNSSLSTDSSNVGLQKDLPALHQPKPKVNSFRGNNLYLFADQARPRSADSTTASTANRFGNLPLSLQNLERSKSPASHLHEKTNFLQLAAANAHNAIPQYQQYANSEETLDLPTHAALKLGALATINSRVALDSNRKGQFYHSAQPNAPHQSPLQSFHLNQHQLGFPSNSQNRGSYPSINTSNLATYDDSINRNLNSSSVPASMHHGFLKSTSNGKKKSDGTNHLSNNSTPNSSTTSTSSSMPADISNPELLNNIPAWLKLLRLHKYTECLKDIYWKDLVELNDEQLEKRGVKALGARRKLLKAFDAVKRST